MEKDAKYIISLTIEKRKEKLLNVLISKIQGGQKKCKIIEHISIIFIRTSSFLIQFLTLHSIFFIFNMNCVL